MTLNNETIIEPCLDNIQPNIPMQRLHFISIDQIQNMETNSFIGMLNKHLKFLLVLFFISRYYWYSNEYQRYDSWKK